MKSSTQAATSGLSGLLTVTTDCPFGLMETVATCLESDTTAQSVGPMGEKRTYTILPLFVLWEHFRVTVVTGAVTFVTHLFGHSRCGVVRSNFGAHPCTERLQEMQPHDASEKARHFLNPRPNGRD
jgi:hypothetical protein